MGYVVKKSPLLTQNKKEASEATNIVINDKISLTQAMKKLKKECNLVCPRVWKTLSCRNVKMIMQVLVIFINTSLQKFKRP